MSEISKLPNIGKSLADRLSQVGIDTPEKLIAVGSRQAWLDIRSVDPAACYSLLCALEGAIEGVRWHSLNDTTKKELKEFCDSFKS